MLRAHLYADRIPLEAYVQGEDCCACGFSSREEFLARLREGSLRPERCPKLDPQRLLALLWAARPDDHLPAVEVLQMPSPGPVGPVALNDPGPGAPILVSGNSTLTIEVLSTVLATTASPFWYLTVDTAGHTVDMALLYETFTAEKIHKALDENHLLEPTVRSEVILPGLAAHLAEELRRRIGPVVRIGPVCAAELPLFFGPDRWKFQAPNVAGPPRS
jgi:CO dehydrogenase/acetyl-CoA synthase gamma subunit (corrinoid Fe-S protein)